MGDIFEKQKPKMLNFNMTFIDSFCDNVFRFFSSLYETNFNFKINN